MTRHQRKAKAAASNASPGGKRIGATAGLLVAAAVLGMSIGIQPDGTLGVAEVAAQSSSSTYGPSGVPVLQNHRYRPGGAAGDMYRPSGTRGDMYRPSGTRGDMYRPSGTRGDMYRPSGVAGGSRGSHQNKAGMGDGSTQARKAGGRSLMKMRSGAGVQKRIEEQGAK